VTVALIAVIALLVGTLAWAVARRTRAAGAPAQTVAPQPATTRILFPFEGAVLSRRALDASLRLAHAENATLLPVFLASVPRHLPLDAALPRQSGMAIATQEAIEQRAARFGVPVDARVERGRTARHALRQAIVNERFDRIVIAAAAVGAPGFHPDDVAWLLANAPGEIIVLRPTGADPLLGAADETAPGRARREPVMLPAAR
jgi:hypothetical protein